MVVQPFRSISILIAATGLFVASDFAQSPRPATFSTPDGTITLPKANGVLGKSDAAAVAELANHLNAVGLTAWGGMQGTGTITYGPQSATSYPATLSNFGERSYRLDAQSSTGPTSIRIERQLGKIRSGSGAISIIPPDAAILGLFPFEMVRITHHPTLSTSHIDHGLVTIGTAALHLVTMEFATTGSNPLTKTPNTTAIDLYFDPATHLLAKTVTSASVPDAREVKFLFVTTYSDYRLVGSTMIPFRFVETMQGEPYRTLQLSNVQLNPTFPAKYFEF